MEEKFNFSEHQRNAIESYFIMSNLKCPKDVMLMISNEKLDANNIEIISIAVRHKLSVEQIKLIAKSEFNGSFGMQAYEIFAGFLHRLTYEQVKLYANPEFDFKQMEQIRLGWEHRLTYEQVKLYANSEFDLEQMEQIRLGCEHRLTYEQVKFYAKLEFPYYQMKQIRLECENRLTYEQVKLYANSEFDLEQMKQIRLEWEMGLTKEQIKFYSNPMEKSRNLNVIVDNSLKLKLLRKGIARGLTIDQIEKQIEFCDEIFNKKGLYFSLEQKEQIEQGFFDGLTVEQVKIYAKPEFDHVQMLMIHDGFRCGLTMEQVKIYAKPELYSAQMNELKVGFQCGLTIEQVKSCADPKIAWYRIKEYLSRCIYSDERNFYKRLKKILEE